MVTSLLYCAAPDAEQARLGRVLAGVLITLSLINLLAGVAGVLLGGGQGISPYTVISVIVLLALYVSNRRGAVTITALGLIGLVILLVPLSGSDAHTALGTTLVLPVLLVIAVALAGVLLSWRWVLLVALAVTAEMGLMANLTSPALIAYRLANPSDTFSVMVLTLVATWAVGGLVAVYSYQMRHTLARVEQQNAELATQSARERALLAQMQRTAAQVSQSAAAITAGAVQQVQGTIAQAAAITQATGTIEELSQAAGQIATAAAYVAAAAEQALDSAAHGQEAVRTSIAGMTRIKTRINEIAARNNVLAEQSQRINEILESINELSTQTHVLALNAAIESAGAGTYGRRFGVVAAEVRRLAQDSAEATRAVQVIVAQNQVALVAAAAATAGGLTEGEAGLQLAQQSGAANDAIITEVERTTQLVQAITVATQQQRAASEQVVQTMREMVGLTRQVATSSQETLAAVNQLHEAAQALGSSAPADVPLPVEPPSPSGPDILAPTMSHRVLQLNQ